MTVLPSPPGAPGKCSGVETGVPSDRVVVHCPGCSAGAPGSGERLSKEERFAFENGKKLLSREISTECDDGLMLFSVATTFADIIDRLAPPPEEPHV